MDRDKRIFKRSEVDPNWQEHGDDWGADIVSGDVFRLDGCWWFDSKQKAGEFVRLTDSGVEARQAYGDVTGYYG